MAEVGGVTNMIPGFGAGKRDDAEAAAFIARIDELMEEWSTTRNEPRYEWASDTLEGIKESVRRSGRVTDRQRQAIDNIENSRRR